MVPSLTHRPSTTPATPGSWFLLGACGAGMKSLCNLLLARGDRVVGTDQDAGALRQFQHAMAGRVQTLAWDSLHNLPLLPGDQVVRSLAVSPDCPALQRLSPAVPVLTLPQALGQFFSQTRQLCVAGTHGKTTTAGMLWWILSQCGYPATRYLGGELCSNDSPLPTRWQSAVIESCEYQNAFHSLSPVLCVLNDVEPDHFDWFAAPEQLQASFQQFVSTTAADGTVITNADCPLSLAIARNSGVPFVSYSANAHHLADWHITQPVQLSGLQPGRRDTSASPYQSRFQGQRFLLNHTDGQSYSIRLGVPGLHNSQNAAAAFLAARSLEIAPELCLQHLATFPGMQRRFEHRGFWRGADLIDDYAHHPTAVRATIRTARAVFPGRRLVVVFEPHQLSRVRALNADFALALALADTVLVLPVLAVRETQGVNAALETSQQLIQHINSSGGHASLVKNLDQVPGTLDYSTKPGDILLTMGAGRTNTIHDEIHRRLQRDSAA